MIVEEIESLAALNGLEDDWNAIYDSDPDAQIFLSWQWLATWLTTQRGPWVILAARASQRTGSRYIAFFPLRIRTVQGDNGSIRNEINMIGNFAADYTGLICDPLWDHRALPAFARHLKTMNWARLHLENVRMSDARMRAFMAAFSKANFTTEVVTRINRVDGIDNGVCPYAKLPNDWGGYLSGLSANTRQKIRRLLKLSDAGDRYRITHADPTTIDQDLDRLLRFWEDKWRLRKGRHITPLVRSNRAMLALSYKAGLLFLPTLWQDDKPIAALAILTDPRKRSFLFYMTGRDETFEGPSSGHILHGHSIRHAIAQGFMEYDFLRGNEKYKYSFGVSERRIHCTIISTKSGTNLGALIDPRTIPDVLEQATSSHQAGRIADAERAYRQVLDIDGRNVDALYRLGQLLLNKPDHAGATRILRKLTSLRPDLYKPWLLLGDCYERLGHDFDAASCYCEVVRIKPDLPETFARVASLLARIGRLEEVNEALSVALSGTARLHSGTEANRYSRRRIQ